MRPAYVAALSALGMLLTSVTVYSVTPRGGSGPRGEPSAAADPVLTPPTTPSEAPAEVARFSAGSHLAVEGRVGHPRMARTASGETYVMLEVHGAEGSSARGTAPVNLALVIDRSGSMKGTRIRNAITAATAAVDRLHDGDVVSVVTFDTRTQVVVPPTTIGGTARESVNTRIRGVALGGDTCISCGLDEAMGLLAQTSGKVSRVLLLSDGDANHGVRDVPGFRAIAQRAQSRGVSVTTIGVDVDYNERIMTALAQDSNGRHYFVSSDAALPRIFELEAESLTRTVASDAEAVIELGPGVELDRVYDRSFRRQGNQVIVPLGSFAGSEVKTVLLKVRAPGGREGVVPIADVEVGYRDLVTGEPARSGGHLAVEMVADAASASELDALVSGRVQRSETAAALQEANTLFEQGKLEEARHKLAAREQALRAVAAKALGAAPAARAADVNRDFERQIASVGDANQGFNQPEFATPPPGAPAAPAPRASRAGKAAMKGNAERALNFGF